MAISTPVSPPTSLLFLTVLLKDSDHNNRLQGLAVLLVCSILHPII